jgi:hypothetical protein
MAKTPETIPTTVVVRLDVSDLAAGVERLVSALQALQQAITETKGGDATHGQAENA